MNKVFLSGNLTRDPEVRYTQTGKAFTRMGIAVRRPYSKDKDAVDFFNLTAWEKTAEFCGRYFMKGSRVLVEGRLQTSSYENKDGVKVNAVDIMVENIEFADSKRANTGGDDGRNYSEQSSDRYSEQPSGGYQSRQSTPPKKSSFDEFDGGEPVDPDDTPF